MVFFEFNQIVGGVQVVMNVNAVGFAYCRTWRLCIGAETGAGQQASTHARESRRCAQGSQTT